MKKIVLLAIFSLCAFNLKAQETDVVDSVFVNGLADLRKEVKDDGKSHSVIRNGANFIIALEALTDAIDMSGYLIHDGYALTISMNTSDINAIEEWYKANRCRITQEHMKKILYYLSGESLYEWVEKKGVEDTPGYLNELKRLGNELDEMKLH